MTVGEWSRDLASPVLTAQHHDDVVAAVPVDGLWVRLATVGALVLVAAFALLRPFVDTPSTRLRAVVVTAATVAVVGELGMARQDADRFDPRAGSVAVVLVTTALAALMVVDRRPGRGSGYPPVVIGVAGVVLGTDPAALAELLRAEWSGQALRDSALVWVAALAWFALDGPARPAVSRTAWITSATVAMAVVAALPGFTATRGGAGADDRADDRAGVQVVDARGWTAGVERTRSPGALSCTVPPGTGSRAGCR